MRSCLFEDGMDSAIEVRKRPFVRTPTKIFQAVLASLIMGAPLALPAVADPSPSDTELSAAYCWGALSAEAQMIRSDAATLAMPNAVSGKMESLAKENDKKVARYRDYLLSKGYLDQRDPLPIIVAQKHGRDDVATCMSAQTPNSQRCAAACNYSADCIARCPQPPECPRVRRCESLDTKLPF